MRDRWRSRSRRSGSAYSTRRRPLSGGKFKMSLKATMTWMRTKMLKVVPCKMNMISPFGNNSDR